MMGMFLGLSANVINLRTSIAGIRTTRGPFAASLAMIKTLCSTNTILDIIEKVIRRVSI